MKKLKLTINGEVKIFDLPENGEYKVEVVNKYVPQVGDCVKVECDKTDFYWFKVKKVSKTSIEFSLTVKDDLNIRYNGFFNRDNGFFNIDNTRIYTPITTEELKAKYAEAGYEWDYESDTIKPLKWMPNDGDEVYRLSILFKPLKFIFDEDNTLFQSMLEKGLFFKTEEECQEFADHCMSYLNNKK